MPANVTQIIAEADRRRRESEERMSAYKLYRAVYFDEDKGGGHQEIQGQDAGGRPLLRLQPMRDELVARKGAPNLLKPIVDDFTGIRSVVPTIKVLPENDSPEAKDEAIKRSRILRAQWDNSRMDVQNIQAAWYLTCLGDVVYSLKPMFKDDVEDSSLTPVGMYISVVDPSVCFPRFKTGWLNLELQDLMIVERITAFQAAEEYGVETEEGYVDRINYLTDDYNCTVVGGKKVNEVEHNLGFCPAVWIRNKLVGADRFAQSEIAGAIEMHQELQVISLVMNDALIEGTYSQYVVRNPLAFTGQIEVGPGAPPIVVQGDGSVDRLQSAGPPDTAYGLFDRMWANIQHYTGQSPTRTESEIKGSNISGRAINSIQAPLETRLRMTHALLTNGYERLNQMILLSLHKLFAKEEVSVYGQEAGSPYNITFTGADLNGWFRNSVRFSSNLGSNGHERLVSALQLHGAGIVPREYVGEEVGLEDVEMLIKQTDEEKMALAKMEQQAQQPPQSNTPGGQQQQIMQPAEQGSSMDAGGMPPQSPGGPEAGSAGPTQPPAGPPPTMPNFPPTSVNPSSQGMGNPGPMPDLVGQVQQIVQSLQGQLRGQIINLAPVKGGVEVVLSDPRDRFIVKKAFAPLGRVKIDVQQKKAA